MHPPLLEVRGVGKSYGSVRALEDVGLRIEAGEIFGLLGPNGAGKTTLLSILAGLLAPDQGTILLEGEPFRASHDQRRHLGLVPQDLALYGELTGRENLRFIGSLYGMGRREQDRRAADLLEAMGLTDVADRRAATYSGGMKRRLNLGLALMHRPRLVLLDEPTVGVDPQTRVHLFEGIRRLREEGTTILYSSHYMEEVQALCPRLAILDRGRLIACDRVERLLRILPGRIRLGDEGLSPAVRTRLEGLGEVASATNGRIELACADLRRTLLKVAALLEGEGISEAGLEWEEPTLERVFLHLTGRALRD